MSDKYSPSWREPEADRMLKREKGRLLARLLATADRGDSVWVAPGLPNVPREANVPMTEPAGPATGRGHRRRVPGRRIPTLAEALTRAVDWARQR